MRWFKRLKGKQGKNEPNPTEVLCRLLASQGFRPRHIVDIGGNYGHWTRAVLRVFPETKVTMFEPQTRLAEKHVDLAEDPRVRIEYAGVGDFDGSAAFSFHEDVGSCSFLYSSDEAARQGMPQETIPIRRLDTAMAESPFGPPDMVKIDAEGLDLKVLAGGPETIAGAQIVLIEATVANGVYPNTAAIVFARMDELGFRLFDITDLNRTPERGVLWLIEAVFVRKDTELASKVQVYI
ncbi:FkbM family methyltransferase [Tabrizicola flagellatus]|uniref:FkbM family methyltransferase n=1 Tax=Tabrizicola flagellatus TaxID=2593021 RepID=UPI0011F0C1C7|nr:FkbM family methyltransferase [Tabrizicola flagellatus]